MATRKNVSQQIAAATPKRSGGTTYLPGTAIPANLSPRAATRKAKADKEVGVATQVAGVVSTADVPVKSDRLNRAVKRGLASAEDFATRTAAQKRADPVPHASMKSVKAAKTKATYGGVPVKTTMPKKAKVDDGMLRFGKAIIPTKRKNSEEGLSIPTLAFEKVSEFAKLFAKLPKGCTVMGNHMQVNIFNRAGALIAEIRTVK